MSHWLNRCLLVLFAFHCVPIAAASERALLDAINSGQIRLQTKVAIPPTTTAAPPLPGADGARNQLIAITRAEESAVVNKAYPLIAAKWPFNQIFVCWENPSEQDLMAMRLVQRAVRETWERHSGLEFFGWGVCTDNYIGIRILIADNAELGAHVKFLGKYLVYDANGNQRVVKNGMVLNFTFKNWNQNCQDMADACIRGIAVHEFGHAIGFAHEQNRPDIPNECTKAPQGTDGDTLLTPWDPHSVMNYCNQKYNNDGTLSAFDIKAVQYIYGTK